MSTSVRTPECRCPKCDAILSGATCFTKTGRAPSVGDATICAYCLAVLGFNNDLTVRIPTGAELVRFATDPRIVAALMIITQNPPPTAR